MTDHTSPVAKLAAGLPKGNGLTRAVPQLFEQRGALVPFVGYLRIERSGLDADDVQHLNASISRFELALGPLERDAADLITRASTQATSRDNGGQAVLFADEADRDALRAEHLAALTEWNDTLDEPFTDEQLTDKWNGFHGGHYDARLSHAVPDHLRAWLIALGVYVDPEVTPGDADSNEGEPGDQADGSPTAEAELVTESDVAQETTDDTDNHADGGRVLQFSDHAS